MPLFDYYADLSHEDAIAMLKRVVVALNAAEDKVRYGFSTFELSERVERLFKRQQQQIENAAGHVQRFLTDLNVYLRAIALVADTVSHASTHNEKNARLRGLVEQVESVIEKLRESNFRFADEWYWRAPDIFRSDYPVREYVRKLREAEAEIKRLKIKAGEADPEPAKTDDDLVGMGF